MKIFQNSRHYKSNRPEHKADDRGIRCRMMAAKHAIDKLDDANGDDAKGNNHRAERQDMRAEVGEHCGKA